MVSSYAKMRKDYVSEKNKNKKLRKDNKKLIADNIKLKADLKESRQKCECFAAMIIDQTLDAPQRLEEEADPMLSEK